MRTRKKAVPNMAHALKKPGVHPPATKPVGQQRQVAAAGAPAKEEGREAIVEQQAQQRLAICIMDGHVAAQVAWVVQPLAHKQGGCHQVAAGRPGGALGAGQQRLAPEGAWPPGAGLRGARGMGGGGLGWVSPPSACAGVQVWQLQGCRLECGWEAWQDLCPAPWVFPWRSSCRGTLCALAWQCMCIACPTHHTSSPGAG